MNPPAKRIPIKAAKEISETYGQRQVILLTYDENGVTHVVTYGATQEECRQAELGGHFVKKALGWPEVPPKTPRGNLYIAARLDTKASFKHQSRRFKTDTLAKEWFKEKHGDALQSITRIQGVGQKVIWTTPRLDTLFVKV